MTCRGLIKNGAVVLEGEAPFPEGTEVRVEAVEEPADDIPSDEETPTLFERLKSVIGKAEGLPPDASVNIDHYLYGLPKR